MTEICGTTPEASVFRRKMSAYPARLSTPSWILAPPESFNPISGGPGLHGHLHDLADLLGHDGAERPAEHREILREDEDLAAVDLTVTGHDAVAQELLLLHAEVGAPVGDELVDLVEGPGVREQTDALARGELPFTVLLLDPLRAAALLGLPVESSKLLELFLRPFFLQPHSTSTRGAAVPC